MEVSTEYTLRDQGLMRRAPRYFSWQACLAERYLGRRVLEVGCGTGNFTAHLLSREFVVCLDVVGECVTEHRRRFAMHPHVESCQVDIQDTHVLSFRNRNLDSIACLNVLEHVADDRKALQHMHTLLPSGGRAVFIVPAFMALYGPIDKNLGHYRRYSKASWRALAESVGFRRMVTRYMNIVGFFGWWFNARVLQKTEQSEQQIAVFDSMCVPFLSRTEALLTPPIGQSIFAVLEKP